MDRKAEPVQETVEESRALLHYIENIERVDRGVIAHAGQLNLSVFAKISTKINKALNIMQVTDQPDMGKVRISDKGTRVMLLGHTQDSYTVDYGVLSRGG